MDSGEVELYRTTYSHMKQLIGQTKIINRLPRVELFNSLKKLHTSENDNATMGIYKNTRNCVKTDNVVSDEFTVDESLGPNGVLSSVLLNTVMDDVITTCKTSKVSVGYKTSSRYG